MSPTAHILGFPSPAELVATRAAERVGIPFLVYRNETGAQVIYTLQDDSSPVTIGRTTGNSICVPWDDNVSRVHAELLRVGTEWVFTDDGVSRNGSYVNGDRVQGRRRLTDGDALRTGRTVFLFRAPPISESEHTAAATELPTAAMLSPAQRRVLIALARPYAGAAGFATPATNAQIAEELVLSIDAVKTHLRAIGAKFGLEGLPQNQKRARLVERAFATGLLTQRDLL